MGMHLVNCRKTPQRGNAIVETSLLLPWIFFLFLAIFNFGFYAYALIAVENAARAAAMYTSGSTTIAGNANFACAVALEELRSLPGIGGTGPCTCVSGSECSYGTQLTVTAVDQPNGPDGARASEVTVRYQSMQLFPLPFMSGQYTFVRTARMRV